MTRVKVGFSRRMLGPNQAGRLERPQEKESKLSLEEHSASVLSQRKDVFRLVINK